MCFPHKINRGSVNFFNILRKQKILRTTDLRNSLLLKENLYIINSKKNSEVNFTISTLANILSKNCEYSTMKNIVILYRIINGEGTKCDEDEKELSVKDLSSFIYAPILSCNMERRFSKYKSMV
jgi:hypothetical protein